MSCLRNEAINGIPFKYSIDWELPEEGVFEFDFIYILSELLDEGLEIKAGFQELVNYFTQSESPIEQKLLTWRQISESLVISMQQLIQVCSSINDPDWMSQSFIIGIGICHDFENYYQIKEIKKDDPYIKSRVGAIKQLYSSFGILNMFSPNHPNGTYKLDLEIYEESQIFKILCELAKSEGYEFMTEILFNDKKVKKFDKEFIDKTKGKGIFIGKYNPEEEKINKGVRMKIGRKYLDWSI